jgi:lipopolysaccharide transport system ATP-binding protein
MICGTLNPTSGSIQTHGRIAALLELGSGFNPEFTGRENVRMSCALLGLSSEETEASFDDIAAFADIGDFIEQPVKTYSSGMFVRLAFAVNIMSMPEIMIVDEALAVGDMVFQAKCMTALTRIQDRGATVLFVSHDISAVKNLCSRGVYLEHGSVRAIGKAPDVAELYNRTMREEMNEERQEFKRASTSAESREPLLKNELVVEEGGTAFKRSEEFDKRVEVFRYGTGGAKITYVEMLGLDDQPLTTIEFDQEVKINIFFEGYTEKEVSVYFAILDEKRNPITGAGLAHIGLPDFLLKSNDRFMVSYRLKLPLEEGNYSVMAQLSQAIIPDQSAEFIDVVDNAVVFSVNRRKNGRLWAKVYLFPLCEIKRAYE